MIAIVDLPPDALASITTYLTKTSVGFFAAAMPPEASKVSEALVSSVDSQHWESIDFMDVTKNVRKKLTDKELAAFLCSIDAVGRVKSLKICHLLGIKGSGLKPLVGSSVLERLDLSTVSEDYFGSHRYSLAKFYSWEKDGKRHGGGGYGAGEFDPHPLLSEEMVLPILDSILETGGRAFYQIFETSIQMDSTKAQRCVSSDRHKVYFYFEWFEYSLWKG